MKMCLLKGYNPLDINSGSYSMKMCLFKDHNPLGINNGSYSFVNFFSTSSLLSFLETQETCGSSPKFLVCFV